MADLALQHFHSMGSTDYKEQSVAEWIQEVASEKREDRDCTRIALVHMRGVDDGREVWVGQLNGRSPKELADIFVTKARSVAQGLGNVGSGVQMFELWAFYGDRSQPQAWHPLPIKAKVVRDGFGSEGPSGLGPEAQRMRHLEGSQAQVYNKQAHLDKVQADMITFLGNSLVNALRENAQLSRDAIMAFAREQDRAHQYRMQEIKEIKSLALQEKVINYMPALANTAFGKEVFPQSTADTSLFTTIVEGMADENPMMLQMFVDGFKDKPEIHGLLSARIAQIIKEKTDKEEARERALNAIPETDPEADAGGTVVKLVSSK